MTTSTARRKAAPPIDPDIGYRPGPLGRLGIAVTRHARLTTVVWLLVIVGLGVFAPKVEAQPVRRRLAGQRVRVRRDPRAGPGALRRPGQLRDPGRGEERRRPRDRGHRGRGPRRGHPDPRGGPPGRRRRPAHARRHPQRGRQHRHPARRRRGRHQRDGPRRHRPQGSAPGPLRRRRRGQPDRSLPALVRLQRGQPRGDAEVRDGLVAGDPGHPGAGLRRPGRRRAAADPDPRGPGRLRRLAGPHQRAGAGVDLGDELRDDVRPGPRHRLRAVPRRPLPGRADGAPRERPAGGRGDDGHRRQGGAALRRHGADLPVGRDARALAVVPLDGRRDHARRRLRAGRDADPAAPGAVQARPPHQQVRPDVGAHR